MHISLHASQWETLYNTTAPVQVDHSVAYRDLPPQHLPVSTVGFRESGPKGASLRRSTAKGECISDNLFFAPRVHWLTWTIVVTISIPRILEAELKARGASPASPASRIDKRVVMVQDCSERSCSWYYFCSICCLSTARFYRRFEHLSCCHFGGIGARNHFCVNTYCQNHYE